MSLIEKLMNISLKEWLEYCYLFLFGLIFADQFLHTTMIPMIYNHEQIHIALRIILICLIFAKLNLADRPNWKKILLIVFLSACFFAAYYRRSHYEELLFMSLLVIGANEVSLDKIFIIYFAIGFLLTIVTMILSQTGAIENLIYYHEGKGIRQSFGIVYPTDFSAHLIYLACAYAYIRRNSYRWLEPICMIFLSWFVLEFCKARNNAGCLLILGVLLICYKFYSKYSNKVSCQIKKILNFGKTIWLFLPQILMLMMFILTYFYNPNNKFLAKMNVLYTGRLSLGRKAFDMYSIGFFGQYIPMVGSGGTVNKVDNYFFIDSSYIKMILCYGLLVSFCILLLFIIIQIRIIKFHDVVLAIVIGVIGIQCMFEHHILEIAYNPFFLIVLTTISSRTNRNVLKF